LSRDAADTPVVLLDRGEAVNPITFDGTNFSGGVPTTQLDIRGGSLLGHITASDGAVADLRTGLDQLAAQLVTAVNAAYNPGGVSTDFFDATGLTAATIAIDPTLTANNIRSTNSTNPGANDVALALADLAATSFSTGGGDFIDGTLSNHYRDLVSGIANATSSATDRLEDQKILQRLMVERRDSVSGVSLDEEMTNLVKYQRAFDANARVMRTLDEMLDIIVNQLVR
jgi:flagellar hook-associated protein 1 FlgK